MLFHEKHKEAIESSDYLEKLVESTLKKVMSDNTGAVWFKDEASNLINKQYEELLLKDKSKLPFYGLSIGLKDLFCVNGVRTTAGSKILHNFISPYDSDAWKIFKDKGSLLGCKLSMDEFAMGSFTNTSYLGRTHVPGHEDRSAGGSSGGSAVAVANDIVDFSLGSDTGGSVRLPASFCSVVGYKPTYGAFSRRGMISYASSLDQAGIFTKKIEDLSYLSDFDIFQKSNKDMTSKEMFKHYVIKNKKDLNIAYMPSIFDSEGVSEDVKKAYSDCIKSLKYKGITVTDIEVELMNYAAQIYYIIACSEASSNLARYQGVYFGEKLIDNNYKGSYWEQVSQYRSEYFGKEVQKRIMLGSFILSAENFTAMYQKADTLRKMLTHKLNELLETYDMLVLPVSPTVAPKWNDIEKMTTAEVYMSDYMTVPFSLAGMPSISMPLYKDINGLGIGMQFIGKQKYDLTLIKTLENLYKEHEIKTI